jgi:hypothetical protein
MTAVAVGDGHSTVTLEDLAATVPDRGLLWTIVVSVVARTRFVTADVAPAAASGAASSAALAANPVDVSVVDAAPSAGFEHELVARLRVGGDDGVAVTVDGGTNGTTSTCVMQILQSDGQASVPPRQRKTRRPCVQTERTCASPLGHLPTNACSGSDFPGAPVQCWFSLWSGSGSSVRMILDQKYSLSLARCFLDEGRGDEQSFQDRI